MLKTPQLKIQGMERDILRSVVQTIKANLPLLISSNAYTTTMSSVVIPAANNSFTAKPPAYRAYSHRMQVKHLSSTYLSINCFPSEAFRNRFIKAVPIPTKSVSTARIISASVRSH